LAERRRGAAQDDGIADAGAVPVLKRSLALPGDVDACIEAGIAARRVAHPVAIDPEVLLGGDMDAIPPGGIDRAALDHAVRSRCGAALTTEGNAVIAAVPDRHQHDRDVVAVVGDQAGAVVAAGVGHADVARDQIGAQPPMGPVREVEGVALALLDAATDQAAVGDPGEGEAHAARTGLADVAMGAAADDVDEARAEGRAVEPDGVPFRAGADVLEATIAQ